MDKKSAQDVVDAFMRSWSKRTQNATVQQFLELLEEARVFLAVIPEALRDAVTARSGEFMPVPRHASLVRAGKTYTPVSPIGAKEDRIGARIVELTVGTADHRAHTALSRSSESLTSIQVSEASGVPQHSICKCMNRLVKKGLVKRVKIAAKGKGGGKGGPRFLYKAVA